MFTAPSRYTVADLCAPLETRLTSLHQFTAPGGMNSIHQSRAFPLGVSGSSSASSHFFFFSFFYLFMQRLSSLEVPYSSELVSAFIGVILRLSQVSRSPRYVLTTLWAHFGLTSVSGQRRTAPGRMQPSRHSTCVPLGVCSFSLTFLVFLLFYLRRLSSPALPWSSELVFRFFGVCNSFSTSPPFFLFFMRRFSSLAILFSSELLSGFTGISSRLSRVSWPSRCLPASSLRLYLPQRSSTSALTRGLPALFKVRGR